MTDLVSDIAAEGGILTDTVTLNAPTRQVYDFGGQTVVWQGPPDRPLFRLVGANACQFRNLRIDATNAAVSAFDITQAAGGQVSTGNVFEDILIEGTGLDEGFHIDYRLGGGEDRNNDGHVFNRVIVNGVDGYQWKIYGTQSMLCEWNKSGGNGLNRTLGSIFHTHSNTVRVKGGGGSNLTGYAYVLGQRAGGFGEIDGAVWENCNGGLLQIVGTAVTNYVFPVRRCRHDQVGGDGLPVIDYGLGVPAAEIVGNEFYVRPDSTGKWKPITIKVNCHPRTNSNNRTAGSLRFSQNTFFHPAPAPAPSISASQWLVDVESFGNQWWVGPNLMGMVKVPSPRS